MRKLRRLSVIGSMLAMALVLMACGVDDDDAATDTSDTEDPVDAEGEEDPVDAEGEEGPVDEGATPFYEGKQLEIVIPAAPGGGTDTSSRFLAELLSETIPGQPTVNPVNIPGGGTIIGANIFAVQRDHEAATSLFAATGSGVVPWLLDNPALVLDYNDLEIVAGFGVGNVFYVNPDETGVNSPEDFAEAVRDGSVEFVAGEVTPDSIATPAVMYYDLLGVNMDIVFGFEGRGPARVAFERGDTNFNNDITPAWQDVEPFVESGDAVPVFSTGFIEGGEVVRDPSFPDLPHIGEMYEMVHGEAPSGPQWEAIVAFNVAAFSFQKTFWLHQDAPQEAVDALIEGFAGLEGHPDFEADREAILGEFPLVVGDDARDAARLITEVDEGAKTFTLDFLVDNYDLEDPRLIGQ